MKKERKCKSLDYYHVVTGVPLGIQKCGGGIFSAASFRMGSVFGFTPRAFPVGGQLRPTWAVCPLGVAVAAGTAFPAAALEEKPSARASLVGTLLGLGCE